MSNKFDDIWNALSEQGACDAIGGCEYERIRQEWADHEAEIIASFIRIQANAGPDDGIVFLKQIEETR